jgi:hypothetical protein
MVISHQISYLKLNISEEIYVLNSFLFQIISSLFVQMVADGVLTSVAIYLLVNPNENTTGICLSLFLSVFGNAFLGTVFIAQISVTRYWILKKGAKNQEVPNIPHYEFLFSTTVSAFFLINCNEIKIMVQYK